MVTRRRLALGAAAGLAALGGLFTACGDAAIDPQGDAAPPSASPEAAAPPCAVCGTARQACPSLDLAACEGACAAGRLEGRDGGVTRDVARCLASAGGDCAAVADCLRLPPVEPFHEGPYGTKPKDTAGPFVLPTTKGDWDFKREWTGEDSYVFLMYAPGDLGDYSTTLYKGSLVRDVLAKSPPHVHYFFLPLRRDTGWAEARDRWQAELEGAEGYWAKRVHFTDTFAVDLPGWIGEMMKARVASRPAYKQYDTMGFAIDRFQRIREVGMLGQLGSNGIVPKLSFLVNEPLHYEFEWARERALAARPATVVSLAKAQTVYDTFETDVTLPDAATMATFDTLEADLTTDCVDHRDGECGAWDYLSHLWVCEPPAAADAGAGDAGTPAWRCDAELARWITSYWREGRWVTDISGVLPLLKGGATHFKWRANGQFDPRKTNYVVSLSLRLSNQKRGMRPVAAIPLWQGGNWNPSYDDAHPELQVDVPAGAKKVELYTLITGHGAATGNCAEFCDHEHLFAVNGAVKKRSFPGARSALGCANDVNKGVVPNQLGTWYFGRGGWCPGQDVAPAIFDVTSAAKVGQANTLSYKTTFGGQPVDVARGNIVLSSYLVVWQ